MSAGDVHGDVDVQWRKPPIVRNEDCKWMIGFLKKIALMPYDVSKSIRESIPLVQLSRSWRTMLEHVRRENNRLTDSMTKFQAFSDLLCHRFLEPPCMAIQQLQKDAIS
ncbi:hypothetical protein V6N12_026930 [Hibiscus sabdariffa]|uniref:Uncharacterized protein n=1 Tax=Hibiscus sabdariffa TaxID=183260 RepID=A0ABR2DT71_9ROSI